MLTYELSTSSDTALYEQLYGFIRGEIESGELAGNVRLPSKRSLSKQLGVSVITVENAYAQLMAEGYIRSEPRKGFFVEDIGEACLLRGAVRSDSESSLHTVLEPALAAVSGQDMPKPEIDFSSNQNEPDSFPFSIWARLNREMLHERRKELMVNPPAAGLRELREAIAMHLKSWRGINVSPAQIIVGAGTDFLYGLLIQLLGFDKIYALEDPGYRKLSRVFHSYRTRFRLVSVDENGLDTAMLNGTDAQVVHVTPSHHFPTGVTMPAGRRRELLGWAASGEDRYIIEDDYDSEFRMNGKPLPALISMDSAGKVIYMNTFTKTLSSTIRVSYMVLPAGLARQFEEELSFYACSVPVLEQYTLSSFINRGYFEKHLNRMRTANRKKRDLLLRLLKESSCGAMLQVLEKNAGLHFLLRLPAACPGDLFMEKLEKRGVRMLPIRAFFHGGDSMQAGWLYDEKQARQTFLVNYSSLSILQLEKAVKLIEECLSEVNNGEQGIDRDERRC